MDGTADEKTLSLCKVIIHFKAAAVLYASHLQGPKTPEVQKHIRQMEYHHMTAALTAMDGISFLTPPSILLVQALIIGVCIFHAWNFHIQLLTITEHDDANHRQPRKLLGAHRARITDNRRPRLPHHQRHQP